MGAEDGTLCKGEVLGGSRVRLCHAKNSRHEFPQRKRGCPGLWALTTAGEKGAAHAAVRDLLPAGKEMLEQQSWDCAPALVRRG